MLKPKYIESLPDAVIELYSQVEEDILADMARCISTYDYWIPSAQWQYEKLIEMGNFHSYAEQALSARTGKSREEIARLMSEAGTETLSFDTAIYKEQGLTVPPLSANKALQKTLNAGLKATLGTFANLTKTTANTATKQFEGALDKAWLQIKSGAFSTDKAVQMACKDLAKQGVQAITYPSGHTDNLEVAVRRAVVTGVNQTCLQLQEEMAAELGADLVETTAHGGARPDHALWQGQVFSLSGKSKKYKSLRQGTGYRTGAGLGGWNCRHSFFPYFEGSPRTYSKEMLEDYNAPKYEYNGKKMTEYEATQEQRRIERNIRKWKRENITMKAAGQDTTESASKIAQWNQTQADFCKQTGLKLQSSRTQLPGWGRSQASKATHDAKILQSMKKDATLKVNSNLPKKLLLKDTAIAETVQMAMPTLAATVPAGAAATNVYAMAGAGTANTISDWKRLYQQYGGTPTKYQKLSGDVVTDNFKYVVHWYECNGKAVEYKISNIKVVTK